MPVSSWLWGPSLGVISPSLGWSFPAGSPQVLPGPAPSPAAGLGAGEGSCPLSQPQPGMDIPGICSLLRGSCQLSPGPLGAPVEGDSIIPFFSREGLLIPLPAAFPDWSQHKPFHPCQGVWGEPAWPGPGGLWDHSCLPSPLFHLFPPHPFIFILFLILPFSNALHREDKRNSRCWVGFVHFGRI